MVKIVIISDTHGMHGRLIIPEGDILIHAGDLTNRGQLHEVDGFNSWLGVLPHKYKIVIAGNHDWCFERHPREAQKLLTNCIYLQDSSVTVEGLKFYGSPWQPEFCNWAFNLKRGAELREKWDKIPKDTDVLITHGPPSGFGDKTIDGISTGCEQLLEVIHKIKPKYHIFGHIHEGYGFWEEGDITYINGSTCSFEYDPINLPIIINHEEK